MLFRLGALTGATCMLLLYEWQTMLSPIRRSVLRHLNCVYAVYYVNSVQILRIYNVLLFPTCSYYQNMRSNSCLQWCEHVISVFQFIFCLLHINESVNCKCHVRRKGLFDQVRNVQIKISWMFTQTHQNLSSPKTRFTVLNDPVWGQRKSWLDCATTQSDQGFSWPQMDRRDISDCHTQCAVITQVCCHFVIWFA